VSKSFPATHPKAGIDTNFILKINADLKKHTIHKNYEYWKNRIDNVKAGKAYLSIRFWSGLPRKSEQIETCKLYSNDGVDVSKVLFDGKGWLVNDLVVDTRTLAKNDGLELNDFNDWFKEPVINKAYALIHFNNYKYV